MRVRAASQAATSVSGLINAKCANRHKLPVLMGDSITPEVS